MEYNNKQYLGRLDRTFEELGKGMDRNIRQEIRAGTYKPAHVPDQTDLGMARMATEWTEAAIRSGQYKPSGIPDPSMSSWSRAGTGMGSTDPGGAKTSFEAVPFDDGDWPFKPIYGLAYGMIATRTDAATETVINFEVEGATDEGK